MLPITFMIVYVEPWMQDCLLVFQYGQITSFDTTMNCYFEACKNFKNSSSVDMFVCQDLIILWDKQSQLVGANKWKSRNSKFMGEMHCHDQYKSISIITVIGALLLSPLYSTTRPYFGDIHSREIIYANSHLVIA